MCKILLMAYFLLRLKGGYVYVWYQVGTCVQTSTMHDFTKTPSRKRTPSHIQKYSHLYKHVNHENV